MARRASERSSRRHSRRLRARRGRRRRRLPGRARARRAASPRWDAAAPTPARWRWRRRSRPTAATSIPMSTASTRPTRASCPRRGAWTRWPSRKCWRWRRSGAKVLQVRSVEVALMHDVPTYVRSSFDDPDHPGEWHADLQRGGHCGSPGRHRHRLLARRSADHACGASPTSRASRRACSCRLAEAGINVDMIVQTSPQDNMTDMTFTVGAADYDRARALLEKREGDIGYAAIVGARRMSPRSRRSASACAATPASPRAPSGAVRKRHQYPRHHHLGDQILGADRRGLHRTRGAHAAHALRPR